MRSSLPESDRLDLGIFLLANNLEARILVLITRYIVSVHRSLIRLRLVSTEPIIGSQVAAASNDSYEPP